MKPIQDNLRAVRIEDEETGDLMPLLDYAGQKFSSLIKAVADTGKVGSITLKVTVRPSTAGAMAVKPEVRVTMPKGLPAEALLWPTPEGNLVAEDPRQEKLELRHVPAQKLNVQSAK
ncbi:MAG: hypothetical protein V5B60_18920 [Accumulibacter sp.]|jgi:hypothetical protein|uniref:hypothetical protein n=1 Tax=Accumulibacter sp. TaxID=2053492 RepID=UPI002FC35FE1